MKTLITDLRTPISNFIRHCAKPAAANTAKSTLAFALVATSLAAEPQMVRQATYQQQQLGAGSSGGENYLPYASPAQTGFSFDYDISGNRFASRKPVFSVALDDNTGPPTTDIVFSTRFDQTDVVESSSFETSLSTEIWGIGLDAASGGGHVTGNETLSTSFFLGVDLDYPEARVSLASLPPTALTQEARDILAIPNVVARTQAWLGAGFGRYVAVGYDLRGKLGITVTLSEQSSFEARNRWADLSASYATSTGSASLGQAVYEALNTVGLSVTIHAEGMPAGVFSIPAIGDIDTPGEQIAWTNSLLSAAANAKAQRGLILVPVNNLVFGPLPIMPNWDGGLVASAAHDVHAAADLLNESSMRWGGPWTLVNFLAQRFIPGTNVSYQAERVAKHIALSARLDEVGTAVCNYIDDTTGSNPALATALVQKLTAMNGASTELSNVLAGILNMTATLPTMQVTGDVNNVGWSSPGPGSWLWIPAYVDIHDAGLFRDGSLTGNLQAFLEEGFSIYADPVHNHGTLTFGGGSIRNIWIEPVLTNSTGPAQGLRNTRLHFEVRLNSSTSWMQVRFEDDLLRAASCNLIWGQYP